jgi:hypothetical protein
MRVNKLTNKVMDDNCEEMTEETGEFDVSSFVKRHKKYIKNVEKTISNSRIEVVKAIKKLNAEKD